MPTMPLHFDVNPKETMPTKSEPKSRRTYLRCAALLAVLPVLIPAKAAEDASSYPSRPIRLVVPYPPGGSSDVLARALGNALHDKLGASVVIENRTGAGGTIAANFVAKAPPDGYTILMGNVAVLSIAAHVYRTLPYDPAKDFSAISMIGKSPLVYAVNSKLPVKNLPELIAYAKKEPGKISFGTSGSGGFTHLGGELLNQAAGSTMVHVPYKGSAPVLVALMSGELDLGVVQVNEMLPLYKSGKVRALGITGSDTSPPIPEIATAQAQGVNGLNITTWFGVVAPAGVPKSIVTKLNTALVDILNDEALKQRYAGEGLLLQGSGVQAFERYIQDESKTWAKIVKDSGFKPE